MPKGAAAMKMGGLSAAIGAGLLACGSLRGWNLPRPHGSSGSGRVRPDPFQPCSPPTVAGAAPALHPERKALRRPSRMRTGFPFHPGADLPGTSMKRIVPKIWGSSSPHTQYVAPLNTLDTMESVARTPNGMTNSSAHLAGTRAKCPRAKDFPKTSTLHGCCTTVRRKGAWQVGERRAQYPVGHIGRTWPDGKGCLTISASSSSGMREGAGWCTP